ncbi:MAG: class I SAM-dependent methyltransferase [Candidatus Aenigmarchaeota archaeon]|nr:class I SAM-dependent methyltransferase [Candidatus Aenigmarchaeota archaeon]
MKKHEIKNHFYNTKTLVELWRDFIDWDKRREGENGFLKKLLLGRRRVFESCLGEGCDTIYLTKEGFDVTSNEIDTLFADKAKDNAQKEGVGLKITTFDWRDIDKKFKEGQFDAVLCLGNSLTYLFSKNDQIKTLKNFRFILKRKGILIIDERNYQYFLDDAESILKGGFRYSGKYTYCGTKVHGRPVEIEENKVVMEYEDERTGKKAYLVLYPFRRGEFLSLLREAGFRKITIYSDFKEGYNKNADFYQYVAVK